MQHIIKKYPVKNSLLKNYIRFFWEISIDYIQLNHALVSQRNINLRFNLSETKQYLCLNGKDNPLEDVFFSGLQDHFLNASLKLNGRVHLLGICFFPDGFYPFLNIPLSEFKNQLFGADEIGFKPIKTICERLKASKNISARLDILESELVLLLQNHIGVPENFRQIFYSLGKGPGTYRISEFCKTNSLSIRTLERLYNKYIGIPANTFGTLTRFHKSMNQLLFSNHNKLSDLAYDNGYFDQMHFISDFKRFSGNSPKKFVRRNNSILQIGKLD